MTSIGLVMSLVTSNAFASGSCGLVGAEKIDFSTVTAFAIRGVEANIEVVPADAFAVREGATVCTGRSADLGVRLTRKGNAVVATVTGGTGAEKLVFSLPRTIDALTVDHQVGALVVRDVPARVAVVSATGLVEVSGADSLRVAYSTGDVVANRVASDVTVDNLAGSLTVDDKPVAFANNDGSTVVKGSPAM
jgi:hypothetical protein